MKVALALLVLFLSSGAKALDVPLYTGDSITVGPEELNAAGGTITYTCNMASSPSSPSIVKSYCVCAAYLLKTELHLNVLYSNGEESAYFLNRWNHSGSFIDMNLAATNCENAKRRHPRCSN